MVATRSADPLGSSNKKGPPQRSFFYSLCLGYGIAKLQIHRMEIVSVTYVWPV